MEYRIVEKMAFTVVGITRSFHSETSYQEIPKFWDEFLSGDQKPVKGKFGVCIDTDGATFVYMIADNYKPWKAIPDGCTAHTFQKGTWTVFPCTLQTLQDTNTRMWKEWLPSMKEYRLSGLYSLEVYSPPEENSVELWLPVEKI